MDIKSRNLVDLILLGPADDRRQLQDSPILGDVWIEFATRPTKPADLLITPYKDSPAGPVALHISNRINPEDPVRREGDEAHVAYLQGLVVARLFFQEVLQIIVPMTSWWQDRKVQDRLKEYNPAYLTSLIEAIFDQAHIRLNNQEDGQSEKPTEIKSADRFFALAGIILWAGEFKMKEEQENEENTKDRDDGIAGVMDQIKGPGDIVDPLLRLFDEIRQYSAEDEPSEPNDKGEKKRRIWQISLNRKAMPAMRRSVPAVKADAARTLFKVKCDGIGWAVLDSGIDAEHPAFMDNLGNVRIKKIYDFTNIRKIISLDNRSITEETFRKTFNELIKYLPKFTTEHQAIQDLKKLAADADNDRPVNWGLVEKFIDVSANKKPEVGHGTHVAGIIGGSGEAIRCAAARKKKESNAPDSTADNTGNGDEVCCGDKSDWIDGMCPEIQLYDFRVLAQTLEETEFAIIAALQFIRYLNDRYNFISIHGANLSLSIPHDVRNFACGRTPICDECERLVNNGVVVVAAAGNHGYQRFETRDGLYEGYTAFSITDPGNADGVITVGATHRFWPHTYGVSFFSSRGPTGDGRLKPDIVAPGERIRSCLPEGEWGELDGTSMAAPHVSGAAAMLLARYSELIGQPRMIKQILCESATDLGRERSFQGHGMLDVLRAFQKI